jgi:transcriptional regulator with XRE-family HTH domain
MSDILRGKGSPTIPTLEKIAGALELEVRDLFLFPQRSLRDRACELMRKADDNAIRALSADEGSQDPAAD